jgi:subtilisin-like proprotein convertase family protein
MASAKRFFNSNDPWSMGDALVPWPDLLGLWAPAKAAGPPSGQGTATAASRALVQPSAPTGFNEIQLAAAGYGVSAAYGSNIPAAWRYATGAGIVVGVVDDGFDPATVATYGNFSSTLSRNFGLGLASATGEPAGGFHGTTTSGLINATGANGTPMGLAPNAIIAGVKVSFGSTSVSTLAQAEQYAAQVSSVVNNSWGFTGFGVGEPNNYAFAGWYAAVAYAVNTGRGGLGDVMVFAAGNDRASNNNLAVQAINADYRVIAVAATNVNGTVAYYSTPGAALLVAAIGSNVVVPNVGGSGYLIESGTSYSSPTVAAIAALMLQVNPALGWRDVQEILADSAYAPAPSASGFTFGGGRGWNGGGMHFSNDLGFGVVDANVAVNLARAWTAQSTSANLASTTATHSAAFTVGINATASSTVTVTQNLRIQHVQVTINDTYLPLANTRLVLIAPDGTQSVLANRTGYVSGRDLTGGQDLNGDLITSNAFWGDTSAGTWTLQVQDISGLYVGTVRSWNLTVLGDNAATAVAPLVYTPEFATLAAPGSARTVVIPGTAKTIDLIALPGATNVDVNGGAGMIDGIAVTIAAGLRNANADGSIGPVTLTGLATGGSTLSGGDGVSVINGAGGDTIYGGFGTTTINDGQGGSQIILSSAGASNVTINSGGGDTIWAGIATATVTVTGSRGDQVYAQSANLTFINGSGASTVVGGTGTVLVQAGVGGGVYYAGTAGNSHLTAGTGLVTFHGVANGDVLTAAGSAADVLIAGAGSETLDGGSSTGAITLYALSGTATMIAGLGRTTFVAGSGTAAITMGGLADILQIQMGSAGGFDTVSGFRLGTDSLHLIGFSYTEPGHVVSTAVSDGHGGTLLNFADSTRVDLLGIASVSQSIFT